MKLLVLVFLAAAFGGCFGADILAIVPMPSRSHAILMERLLIELGDRGHSVTLIAAMTPSEPIPDGEVILVPGIREAMMSIFPKKEGNVTGMLAVRKINPWLTFLFSSKMSSVMCEHILNDPGVQNLITSDRKFDLILGENMLDEVLLAGFSNKFSAPIVALSPTMPTSFSDYLVGNPAPAAYIPDLFLGYSDKMDIWQRMHNLAFGLVRDISHGLLYLPKHDSMLKTYFGEDTPYVGDILKNTSLVLVNHHFGLGFPRPSLPNVIEVAGFHIKTPKKNKKRASDPDFWEAFNNAKDGVILFSLGTNTNSSELPPETIQAFLETFAKLPQLVVWKYEEALENVPSNVMIKKWLPQTDILANSNLKAFITHGGLLSTTEAMMSGVPVIGIPLGGDQFINMNQVVAAGWGVQLELDQITVDSFYEAITEVLTNPSYKEKAETRSTILKDNPMEALETSVWWIEYVIRHKGAPHLKSAAQSLTWYQIYLLDIYAIVAVVVYVNYRLAKCVLKKVCKNARQVQALKGKRRRKRRSEIV